MSEELKPCPFCSAMPRWCGEGNKDIEDDHDCHHIHCDNCGAHFDLDNFAAKDTETMCELRDVIAKAWNKRVEDKGDE